MGCIEDSIGKGAKLIAGGKREGNIVYPTILVKTSEEMVIDRELCFGPVVSISTYDDPKDAIERINNLIKKIDE